jgi:hypothetical protein
MPIKMGASLLCSFLFAIFVTILKRFSSTFFCFRYVKERKRKLELQVTVCLKAWLNVGFLQFFDYLLGFFF